MDNGYQYHKPVVDMREGVAAGSAADVLKFDVVRTGRVQIIENVAILEATNAPTSVEIFMQGGGKSIYLDGASAPTAGIIKAFKGPFLIPEGYNLAVYFYGATLNNAISAYVNGRELTRGE